VSLVIFTTNTTLFGRYIKVLWDGRRMWHVWSTGELDAGFCCGDMSETDQFRKYFVQVKGFDLDIASSPKAYWSFPCVVVALSPSLTQKKMAYCWAVFCASIFVTRFTNTSWHVRHLLHIESLQRHATASKDRERIKVNGCLCWWAAVLSVQQEKKLVSLLYCQTSYMNLRQPHIFKCQI
jgi:hypothetical protein